MAFLEKRRRSVKKLKPADVRFITINLTRFDAYAKVSKPIFFSEK